MDNEDLDATHWDDNTYLKYLDEREALKKKVNTIHRNVLETTFDRRRLNLIERSIENYKQILVATQAQYS
jgi:F0F1-type ATP synthase delta subunit